jgi:hypothetical protein
MEHLSEIDSHEDTKARRRDVSDYESKVFCRNQQRRSLLDDRLCVSQVISYLGAAKLRVGLLINFNAPTLRAGLKRIVL